MGIKDKSIWARDIISFLETAKSGTISGTAQANAMKQSNLSKSLKNFEDRLKCQVLERTHSGVRLTQNGREVFKLQAKSGFGPAKGWGQVIYQRFYPSF